MNCHDAETLLLAGRDRAPDATQRAALAAHVAGCAHCRQLQAGLDRTAAALVHEAAAVRVPDADAEWLRLRRRLRSQPTGPAFAPVLRFAAPLAAAAAIAVALLVVKPDHPAAAPATDAAARADYVEVADTDSTPMVYLDKESGWLVVWAVDADTTTKG